MLAILSFISMSRKLLATVSVSVGSGLFLLGFWSAHSEGSLTWPAHNVYLLFCGSTAAAAMLGISISRHGKPMPPPPLLTQFISTKPDWDFRLYSLREKMLYLYAGALAGGLLGQIFIYGSVNDRSTFDYYRNSFEDIPFLLILIAGGSATPIVVLLSQLRMDRAKAIRCSLVVAILVLGLSVVYGQYDSLFGHDALGYNILWFAGILAALAALTVQKRGLCGQAFSSRA